jgi:hypothetical protein
LEEDYLGDIIKKDRYGNIMGIYRLDYLGNWIYHPSN